MIDGPRTGCVVGALLAVALMAGCGGDNVASERTALRAKAEGIALAKAEDAVRGEDVAADLDFGYPVAGPTRTTAETEALIHQRVQAQVLEKFPEDMPSQLRAEVEAKYPLRKIGEQISMVIRGGLGPDAKVEGEYRGVIARHVKIGERLILREDFEDKDRALLDPEFRKLQIEKEYRAKLFLAKEERTGYAAEQGRRIGREVYEESGYAFWDGQWQSRKEIYERKMNELIERERKLAQPEAEIAVFAEAGFVLKDGEWQPSLVKRTTKKLLAPFK